MKKCHVCDSTIGVELHHIDFIHSNNDPDNRIWLCKRCHTVVHQCDYTPREVFDRVRQQVMVMGSDRFSKLPLGQDPKRGYVRSLSARG